MFLFTSVKMCAENFKLRIPFGVTFRVYLYNPSYFATSRIPACRPGILVDNLIVVVIVIRILSQLSNRNWSIDLGNKFSNPSLLPSPPPLHRHGTPWLVVTSNATFLQLETSIVAIRLSLLLKINRNWSMLSGKKFRSPEPPPSCSPSQTIEIHNV